MNQYFLQYISQSDRFANMVRRDDVVVLWDKCLPGYGCCILMPLSWESPGMAFTPVIHCYEALLSQCLSHKNPLTFLPWLCVRAYCMSENSEAIKQNTLNMTGLRCNLRVVQTMKDYSLLQVFFLTLSPLLCLYLHFPYWNMCLSKHIKMIIYEWVIVIIVIITCFIKQEIIGFSSDSSPSQMYYFSYYEWINQLIN